MALQVLVGPTVASLTDVTAATDIKSVLIKETGYSGIAVANFRLITPSVTPLAEWAVRINDGGVKAFEGKIKNPERSDSGLGPTASVKKYYDVECQDNSSYLTDDVIDDAGGLRTTVETDQARVVWLITTYSRFLTAAVPAGGYVQQVKTGNMPDQDLRYLNLWEALEEVCKITGARFYVDEYARVHYLSAESATAPFNLSDTPNGSTTFGYKDLILPSESYELTNAVLVVGGAGTVPVWRPDPSTWPTASHTTYGRREGVLRLPDETVQDNLLAAGDAFVAANGTPSGPVKLTLYRPGLRAGMLISITNALWSMSAVQYPIVEWQAKPMLDDRQLEYTLTLGSKPVTLGSIIEQQGGQIGNIGAGVAQAFAGDKTAPANPTGLVLSSDLAEQADGNKVVRLIATLTQPTASDLFASYVEVTSDVDGSGNPVWTNPATIFVGAPATSAALLGVRGSTLYHGRAYAVDVSGNRSAQPWPEAETTTVRDDDAPAVPVNVALVGGYRAVAMRWDTAEAPDLMLYEVRYAPDDGSGTGPDTAHWTSVRARTNVVWINGLTPDLKYWAQVRAVDFSGNVRTSESDPTAVDWIDYPEAGWTGLTSAIPTALGAADFAADSILARVISAGSIDATDIKTGLLKIGTTDGYADGLEVWYNGKKVGKWDETGLYVGKNAAGLPDNLSASDYVRITDAGVTVYLAGVAQAAITPDGINASAVQFGTLPGGHNLLLNSGFELADFAAAPATAVWDVAADWNASRVGSDTNVTTGANSLTVTGTSY